MPSDILLVLHSDQRQLMVLADRCRRSGRGLEDPEGDLRAALTAHATALLHEVLPRVRGTAELAEHLDAMISGLPDQGSEKLADTAEQVVEAERQELTGNAATLSIDARRRLGKAFRIRRQAALRARGHTRRVTVSQSELYEIARRAGISQRSKMTHAELLQAVHGAGATLHP